MHRQERPSDYPQPGHPYLQTCEPPLFVSYTHEVGNNWFLAPQGSSQFSAALTVFLTPSTHGHPSFSVRDQGPLASGQTAPHNYACDPSQHPQLNKSPPTSESIQATVRENKQAFAQTERRNQLNHSQREHAEGSLPNLFCSFRALIVCFCLSPLEPGQSRRNARHIGRLKLAYNCGYWKRITMVGTAWKPLSQWTGGVLTGPATHTSGLVSWWPPMACSGLTYE